MNEPVLQEFCRFAKPHVLSGDIDPAYPLLKRLYQVERLSKEEALWRTLVYVTWYNLGSTATVWQWLPSPPSDFVKAFGSLGTPKLPTGIERRGFRGNGLAWVHLSAALYEAKRVGSISAWVDAQTAQGGAAGWLQARESFSELPHGGPWSSYKWADLLKHVHGYPITASDIGVGGGSESAGPIPGMVRVTGLDWKTCARDIGVQEELHAECVRRGVPFNGLDQLETSLCDFNSLCKGGYYLGHDIDLQAEHLKALGPLWWESRAKCFTVKWCCEASNGVWFGVRKHLKTRYRDKGEMLFA